MREPMTLGKVFYYYTGELVSYIGKFEGYVDGVYQISDLVEAHLVMASNGQASEMLAANPSAMATDSLFYLHESRVMKVIPEDKIMPAFIEQYKRVMKSVRAAKSGLTLA